MEHKGHSILQEMKSSISQKNFLGAGVEKAVFRFNDPSLAGYVFGVKKDEYDGILDSTREEVKNARARFCPKDTEFLKPIQHFLGDRDFGQSLLENDLITIMPIVNGINMRQVEKGLLERQTEDTWVENEALATRDYYQYLSQIPLENYVTLFDDIRFVREHGHALDLYSCLNNFMLDFDNEKIKPIDLMHNIGSNTEKTYDNEWAEIEKHTDNLAQNYSDAVITILMSSFSIRDEIDEQNELAPDTIPYAQETFLKMVKAASEAQLPANPDLRVDYAFEGLMYELGLDQNQQELVYQTLESVNKEIVPVYKPKATITNVATISLEQKNTDLIEKLTEIRQCLRQENSPTHK